MTRLTVTLEDGIKVGENTHKTVELGELSAGDVIDASREAEYIQIVTIGGGQPEPTVIVSPSLLTAHTLRRQMKKLGDVQGPIAYDLVRKLSNRDFQKLMQEAETLSSLKVGEEADRRGRDGARPKEH